MPLPVKIEGANGNISNVDAKGALKVADVRSEPPEVGAKSLTQYHTAYLSDDGLSTGVTSMNVNGTTPREFYLESQADYDIHITAIIIIIADTKNLVTHNAFGGVAELVVGWDLIMTESGIDTNIIDKTKTNGEVIAQSGIGHAFGDGATSFIITDWNGSDDALSVVIPIHSFMPNGIRIGRGTKDKIRSNIAAKSISNGPALPNIRPL